MAKRSALKTRDAEQGGEGAHTDDLSSPERETISRRWNVIAAAIALVGFGIICTLSNKHVMWPEDQYTDMNILMSGENFAEHGLFKLRGLPVHYVGAMTDPPDYYTHYPPLANIVNGLLRMVGINTLSGMRISVGALGIIGLFCMYLAYASAVGAPAAACGLAFIITTGFFWTFGIGLHHAFNIFFLGVFILLFTRAIHSDSPARKTWAGCWIVLFLSSLTSFEFIIYAQVFAWVYALATGQLRRRLVMLMVLASAPVAGVGAHFLQNVWALGWSAGVADAIDAFKNPARGTLPDRWTALGKLPEFLIVYPLRLFYWSWVAMVALAAAWTVWASRVQKNSRPTPRLVALIVAVVAATPAWYLFMPGHSIAHIHTTAQLFPLAMLVMGGVVAWIGRGMFARGVSIPVRVLAGVAVLAVIFGQTQSISNIRDRATDRPDTFHLFQMIAANLPPKTAILTNTYADAHLAYFVRRPVWRSPTHAMPFPESIQSIQQRLPEGWDLRYYVHDLFNRGTGKTLELLASTCRGKSLEIPDSRYKHALVVFDIEPLHHPPDQRVPLDEEIKQQQLAGEFKAWDLPGYQDRLDDLIKKYEKQ